MTGKQLKDWATTLPDEAIIEVHRYSWEKVKAEEIRAMLISSPMRSMADVCNAEEVSA